MAAETGLSTIISMDVAGKTYHNIVKSVKIQCSSSNSMGIGGTAPMRSMPCIAYLALKSCVTYVGNVLRTITTTYTSTYLVEDLTTLQAYPSIK